MLVLQQVQRVHLRSLYTNTGAVDNIKPSKLILMGYEVGVNMASLCRSAKVYVGFTYDIRGTIPEQHLIQGDLAIDLSRSKCMFELCQLHLALTASNVTGTSADVSWTAGGTETEWFLIVNGAGTTQTSTTC